MQTGEADERLDPQCTQAGVPVVVQAPEAGAEGRSRGSPLAERTDRHPRQCGTLAAGTGASGGLRLQA